MTNVSGTNFQEKLEEPMLDSEIEWKIQTVTRSPNNQLKGLAVPYVQARAVQSRLDSVFGPMWSSSFKVFPVGNTTAVECTISVYIDGVWVSRSDAAEVTHIEAIKGGYSDALKRCGVQWGVGRFLYSMPQLWVDIVNHKPNNDQYEYISGKYKIQGREEYIKGYYVRPSILNLLKPKQTNQAAQTKSRGNQQPLQNVNQSQKMQKAQQFETNQAQRNVIDCFKYLNIPLKYLPHFCEMVNIPKYSNIEQIKFEELQLLYGMMHPVKMYIQLGREHFRKNDEQLFAYASELIGKPIGKVYQLFNMLNADGVNEIFNRIRTNNTNQQKMA